MPNHYENWEQQYASQQINQDAPQFDHEYHQLEGNFEGSYDAYNSSSYHGAPTYNQQYYAHPYGSSYYPQYSSNVGYLHQPHVDYVSVPMAPHHHRPASLPLPPYYHGWW